MADDSVSRKDEDILSNAIRQASSKKKPDRDILYDAVTNSSIGKERILRRTNTFVEICEDEDSRVFSWKRLHRVVEQTANEPLSMILFKWVLIVLGFAMLASVLFVMGDILHDWATGRIALAKIRMDGNGSSFVNDDDDDDNDFHPMFSLATNISQTDYTSSINDTDS